MERDGDDQIDGQPLPQSSTFLLEHVGEVVLTSNLDGLSWKSVESSPNNNRLTHWDTIKMFTKSVSVTEIKFSDIYAAEFINHGVIHGSTRPNRESFQMYRFTVHGFKRSKAQPCVWVLAEFTFGHRDRQTCEAWVKRVCGYLELEEVRPKNLMVFVHPRSGKGNGCKIWASLAPIFSSAEVKTKVIVTERAGHGFDVMASLSNKELDSYDGVVAVGGDGFFNEIINGFLKNRHKTSYPPAPSDFVHGLNETAIETFPLPSRSHDASCSKEPDHEFLIPNERFRFGIIPAGSTDAVVMCTTGARDPVTSALHIVLGKKVSLDLAQVVRWKLTSASKVEPSMRYAASFAGYGFYGDVITESEKLRWMGPKRYDYAGTKMFLMHRSYEAEISYLEVKSEERKQESCSPSTSERVICRANCDVCSAKASRHSPEGNKWVKSRGRYISVGAAIISCRNKRAPDGLVADAHLSDGLLDLILIKDCPHALYLWHLTQLAQKGGKPLDFKFVEHYKTLAFTFTSSGKESVWNLDGEIFEAHQLSAQVCRGLIILFATGPQV